MLDVNMRNNKSFFASDSRENPYEWAIYTTRAHNAYDENGDFNYMYYNDLKFNFSGKSGNKAWRRSKKFWVEGNRGHRVEDIAGSDVHQFVLVLEIKYD